MLYIYFGAFTCRNTTGESLMITWTGSPAPPEELRAEPDPPLPAAPKNIQNDAESRIKNS